MNAVFKLTKWLSVIIIFLSSFWVGFLSYFSYAFTDGADEKIFNGDVKVSLATEVLSHNWFMLVIVSILIFLTGIYLVLKIRGHLALYLMLALSSSTLAFTLNVLVISAGFELS